MIVRKINGASLKVQIFLYYAEIEKNSTCVFPDFEQDMTEYSRLGLQKVERRYEEKEKEDSLYTKEEYMKTFNWAARAEARILADKHAREIRDELVAEGFLWTKDYKRGTVTTTYTGLTEKGKKWVSAYISKYGKAVIENGVNEPVDI